MRIAYMVNQYPKVSHSFIRREILALERAGFEVLRVALRGWADELADKEDVLERERTRYILQRGILPLLWVSLLTMFGAPRRFLAAFWLALKMGWRADRPLPFHLIYLAEACQTLVWLKNHGAVHVHAHFGTNSTEVAMLAAVMGGPPYSFTVHGPEEFDKPQYLRLGEKIRRSAFTVAVSSYGRSQLYRWVEHAHWPKIQVVRCGLEPAFRAETPSTIPAAPRLVCVGRLCEQKGQLLLIEAARRLAESGTEFELVLAGDGEMRAELDALIRRHDLARHVHITGWISSARVREELLASRGLVLPSFAEGLPVVIMEAMALRRPVLSTYVAGIPELVRPGENGWLFPAGSVEDLVDAMRQCLSAPADTLQRMGEAGYRLVSERHSVDAEAARLAALIRESGR